MNFSRRRFLVLLPAAAATLIAACAGEEDEGVGRRSAGANTPVVVRNATPLALSSPNPACLLYTSDAADE